MSPALQQRQLALAGVALLAAILALGVTSSMSETAENSGRLPRSVPAADGGWYQALAVARDTRGGRRQTACGHIVEPATMGVAHPVLPCGAKIFVAYGDVAALTQVVDRGPSRPGRTFELTAALAMELGLEGVQPVRWRFAAGS